MPKTTTHEFQGVGIEVGIPDAGGRFIRIVDGAEAYVLSMTSEGAKAIGDDLTCSDEELAKRIADQAEERHAS